MLFARWILLCHFWTDSCQRRWLLALLHTSLPINDKRNSPRQKVKLAFARRGGFGGTLSCLVLICFDVAVSSALSLEPYGLSLPISMSSCSIADRQSPTLLSMSSGLSGNSTDPSHKGGYVDATHTRLLAELLPLPSSVVFQLTRWFAVAVLALPC